MYIYTMSLNYDDVDFNKESLEFLYKNNIKFMPLNLGSKTGKVPQKDSSRRFRFTKTDGTTTNTPDYTQFLKLTDEQLFKRQQLLEENDYNALGIDTNDTFQIDIDTDKINPDMLNYMIQNFPYYKSLTKYYGYHFFVRIDEYKEGLSPSGSPTASGIAYKPKSVIMQFINMFNGEDIGKVELLCGQWGYFSQKSIIENMDKPIPVFQKHKNKIQLLDGFELNLRQGKTKPKPNVLGIKKGNAPLQNTKVGDTFSTEQGIYPNEEIREHMLNIDPKYISKHDSHFRICVSLFKYGYDEIAFETIPRIVNPKPKDFNAILNSWKLAKNDNITLHTFFYFSKISNETEYKALLRKYRGISLNGQLRKELFSFNMITEKLNTRYLPKNLIIEKLKDREKIVHIKSQLGTGKTTIMKNYIHKFPDKKILYFAPRIAFANDIHSALKDYGFEIYTDIRKKKKDFNYDN